MQNKGDDKDKLPEKQPDKTPTESSPKKKRNIFYRMWRAWADWWKLTFESYVVEVEDRILMSWKRIIKFLGITIIPILYGVICSVAMWNPVEALGKGTTYIMDDDYSVLLVSDADNNEKNGQFSYGTVKSFNNETSQAEIVSLMTKGTGLKADDIVFDPIQGTIGIKNSAIKNDVERQKMSAIIFRNVIQDNNAEGTASFHLSDGYEPNRDDSGDNGTIVDYAPDDAGFSFQIASTWTTLKQMFLPKTDSNAADTKYTFKAPAFLTHPEVALQNIHYSSDTKWNDKYYQKRKGWIQAKIPAWYMARTINYASLQMRNIVDIKSTGSKDADAVKNMKSTMDKLVKNMNPLGLWTTYEKNFLFGYMFDMMSGLLGSYIAAGLPATLNTAMVSNLSQYLSVDGPTLASLVGQLEDMNDKDDQIAIAPDGYKIDMSKRYVLDDSTSLTANDNDDPNGTRLKNASLFGDALSNDGDPSQQTIDGVGGKFINTLETAMKMVNNPVIGQLLGGLGNNSAGLANSISKLSDAIQNLVNEIINIINKGNDNATVVGNKLEYKLLNTMINDPQATNGNLSSYFQIKDDNSGKWVDSKDVTYSFDQTITNGKAAKPGTLTVDIALPKDGKKGDQLNYLLTGTDKTNVTWTQPINYKLAKDVSAIALNTMSKPLELDTNGGKNNDFDEALLVLNSAVYGIFNGKPINKMTDKQQKALQTICDSLGLKIDVSKINNIQQAPLNVFNNGKTKVLSEAEFDKGMDNFIAANSDVFFGAKTVNDILPDFVANESANELFNLKLGNIVSHEIQGDKFGYEGIGLGVFFLTVGLFVGCILHSFIFDRAKRLTKAKWSNWYFSKYMLLLTVAFFQVTAEVWVVYAAGWHAIGAAGMCYVWLWLLACDFMFTTIVQALWFSLKDEIIGKFLCVIVLVTSISAGGGEFPAYSEFGFFRGISYIVPFTYVINGFDEIAFRISLAGTHAWSTRFMFQQWGITLIYDVLFLALGMALGAQLRMKEMNYGSHYGFAVAGAMRALGRDTSEFQVLKKVTRSGKKRYYYNWKALEDGFMPELYFQCRRMYKFAGEFKWWRRKHHDFVQKPNYSDEEIVSRNE